MAYEVTATRKRPRIFDELAGQEFVVSTLKSSVAAGRIAHAYLFSGPRGVGKTSAARILARALNCEKGPTPNPCGECAACAEITRGNSLDVIEIDGASNTSVNDVREIRDEILFTPNSSRFKIYIIDEVHMLSNSAFNALLKTIEEPPPHVVFIFATTEIHKVPATIRSRCQQFSFRLLGIATIRDLLARVCTETGTKIEDEALLWIAKEAGGSQRDAYTLLDQVLSFAEGNVTMDLIRRELGLAGLDTMSALVEAMAAGKADETLEIAAETLDRGVSVEQLITDLAEYFRSLLFIRHGVKRESLIGYSPSRFSTTALESFTPTQLEQAVGLLLDLYRNIRFSLNQRFELDLVLSRLASLGGYLTPSEILTDINEIRGLLGAPAGSSGRPGSPAGTPPRTGPANPTAVRPAPRPSARTHAAGETPERGRTSAGPPTPPPASRPSVDEADADSSPEIFDYDNEDLEGEEWPGDSALEGGAGTTSPGPQTVKDPVRDEIIEALRKTKLTLASTLEKAVGWQFVGGALTITFDNGFSANLVEGEREVIIAAARAATGTAVKLTVLAESSPAEAPQNDIDGRIELVKKIFRGEVIQGGES